jgi:hypothetical protein
MVTRTADCAFGPPSITVPMDVDDMVSLVSILIELKVNDGMLAGSKFSVGKYTSQQLV